MLELGEKAAWSQGLGRMPRLPHFLLKGPEKGTDATTVGAGFVNRGGSPD